MSIDNLPDEKGPVDDAMTYDQQVEDISNLLGDPEPDPAKDEDANAENEDDPEIELSPEDVADEDSEETDDGSVPEIKGGRFAPDSAKVTLDDGTVTSVAELKRNTLFQRDYTRKTTELSAEREQMQAHVAEVNQRAQSLSQQADYIEWFSQNYLPQAPQPPSDPNDPVGYLDYVRRKEAYEQVQGTINYFQSQKQQAEYEARQQHEQQSRQEMQSEMQALVSKDKLFADNTKAKAFLEEVAEKGAEWWGVTRQDIGQIRTAKAFLILRDAMRYRKAVAKAPELTKQVSAKPQMVTGGKRAAPGAKVTTQRAARSEALRSTGSFDAGVKSLMDLDL